MNKGNKQNKFNFEVLNFKRSIYCKFFTKNLLMNTFQSKLYNYAIKEYSI